MHFCGLNSSLQFLLIRAFLFAANAGQAQSFKNLGVRAKNKAVQRATNKTIEAWTRVLMKLKRA
jgi:hypothetical protein